MDDPLSQVEQLAADRTLGAAETAEAAARVLAGISREGLPDAVEVLLRGHPSMAPMWRLADVVLRAKDHARASEAFVSSASDDVLAAATLAPNLPGTLLTISSSSSVAEAIRIRRPRAVVCMASQPGGEGLRMAGTVSAWAEASVMDDDQAIRTIPAEAVLVGADAVTPTAVVNKVRTADLAEAARTRGIPCYAIAGSGKFISIAVPVVPPFEATRIAVFAGIATAAGLLTPEAAAEQASRVRLHPALAMLAERL